MEHLELVRAELVEHPVLLGQVELQEHLEVVVHQEPVEVQGHLGHQEVVVLVEAAELRELVGLVETNIKRQAHHFLI